MSAVATDDRWTCPACIHTEVLQVVTTLGRARARLRRVQEDHGRVHAREARTRQPRRRDGVSGGAR